LFVGLAIGENKSALKRPLLSNINKKIFITRSGFYMPRIYLAVPIAGS
jgi:hypothetical protein